MNHPASGKGITLTGAQVVLVCDIPGMLQVKSLNNAEIHATFTDNLQEDWVVRADGWPAYGIENSAHGEHQPVVTSSGRMGLRSCRGSIP